MRVLFLILLLLGCQHVDKNQIYNHNLSHWLGWPETKLYAVWGQPTQVFYVMPNEKVVSYLKSTTNGTPNDSSFWSSGFGITSLWDKMFEPPAMWEQPPLYYCKTSFVIKNGVVAQYNFNGDYCGSE